MLVGDSVYLSIVIQQLNEGTGVFQAALKQCPSAPTQEILGCAIKARQFAADYLQKMLSPLPQSQLTGHAFGSVLHKMYPDMLNRLPEETDQRLVTELAQVEEDTRKIMQSAVDNVASELLRSVLIDLNPRLNRSLAPLDKAC